jgi:hypothetical protein
MMLMMKVMMIRTRKCTFHFYFPYFNRMMIVENRLFEFISVNGTFKFTGNSGTENDVDDMPINYKIQATKGFCFHCTKLRAVRDYTRKDFNGTSAVEVILNGFQVCFLACNF